MSLSEKSIRCLHMLAERKKMKPSEVRWKKEGSHEIAFVGNFAEFSELVGFIFPYKNTYLWEIHTKDGEVTHQGQNSNIFKIKDTIEYYLVEQYDKQRY